MFLPLDLPFKELLLGLLPSNHIVETEQMLQLEAFRDNDSLKIIFPNLKVVCFCSYFMF